MIEGAAKPLAAPLLLPPSPGRRADPNESPSAHGDNSSPAQRPEEAAPHPSSSASSPTLRASSQLNQWSRARALRSGRRLGRGASFSAPVSESPPPSPSSSASAAEEDASPSAARGDDDSGVGRAERDDAASGKAIYMVSDGTGWTAEHSVNAALGQFELCLADRRCAVSTHLFSGVDDMDKLIEIIKQAAKEGALVLYTIADHSLTEAIKKACDFWGVPSTDVLRPTVDAIASHIGVAPSGISRCSPIRQAHLTEDYFQRIFAIEFTIKQDDGAQPQNLNRADIVLVGVSRTGKTPLSIYLAQKGYKVANVPIVMGVDLPKPLFEINQDKIFGLTINPAVLQGIRKTRAKTLGFDDHKTNYAEMEHVRQELAHANKIFAKNPAWPVIEITGKAIEETAAVVVRIHHDRKQKCSMPRISKRY